METKNRVYGVRLGARSETQTQEIRELNELKQPLTENHSGWLVIFVSLA